MIEDMQCPYCGAPQEVNRDSSDWYEENIKHDHQCRKCEQSFVFTTSITFSFTPYKAKCIDTDEHKFAITHTYPIEMANMECVHCGLTREMTIEERKQYCNGRTKKDYFNNLKNGKQ